ncbi:N-acetyltransferase [Haloferax sp. Atlit-6N]|uniref:GNAT family acetyltransferase n=1 Tax=Haloferax gibbonsii (strain ATCC 33959 / DSM 4427 / JCM 8863 / NBRC 102184 / NCIMB 2188 / Ma 2.38) TaxID=1227459 RepID=M0H5Y5_HALGM|nr:MULTISPECIES: GNAT family N-acetyltransferase [Haloferax]ELZ79198.1 GNAT family acetyltransferase [Haloferax gibbonsii ATCC 33959]RDZ52887.1 N-acetyltransferase [Haloferax sp. Atlit-4N]REA02196.1 N-acetyltransferase [Haloferax sp. Atlit-6N]
MPALWRLTRTETARRVYDALKARGLTATQMDEYVADADAADVGRDPPAGVEIRALDPAEATRFEARYDAFSELRGDETAVCAFDGGADEEPVLVGYLFLGDPGLTYRVHPLEADVTFPGGYVRRVFVAPEARNRGIATALVSRAVAVAGERGAETVHALVARDNRPSQWTFESVGFRVARTRAYYRVGPWRRRRVKPRS